MTKDDRMILNELDEFDKMVKLVEDSGIILSYKHYIRKLISDQFDTDREDKNYGI